LLAIGRLVHVTIQRFNLRIMHCLKRRAVGGYTRIYSSVACHIGRTKITKQGKKLPLMFGPKNMSSLIEQHINSTQPKFLAKILYGIFEGFNVRHRPVINYTSGGLKGIFKMLCHFFKLSLFPHNT